MAVIDDLISQINDPSLRERIREEIQKTNKQRKFGLVFENHLPECTPLYDVPIRRGSLVAEKGKKIDDTYLVVSIDGDSVTCANKVTNEKYSFNKKELVVVAEFGKPIYPYLKPIDSVCNAPDSELWHTLIEADNYHALQLLEYMYAGKVDCIYIDPPYNGRQHDWKYNNDYVDPDDSYAHSKWLSLMERRLKLAKKILNPTGSVLILTIDEKEYLHIGCLLEQLFPDAKIQMVSSVINHASVARFNEFNRNNEYIFYVMIGDYTLYGDEINSSIITEVEWATTRRRRNNPRPSRPNQFYPIYINIETREVVEVGEPIAADVDRFSVKQIDGCIAVFPVMDDGFETLWSLQPSSFIRKLEKGCIFIGKYQPDKPQPFSIQHVPSGGERAIDAGIAELTGKRKDGRNIFTFIEEQKKISLPKTQWDKKTHDGKDYGTAIISELIGNNMFDFPKSIYAVKDCISLFVKGKKDALIVDFFAGSGTTYQSVNLINQEDGGHRRCICITNNEVSAKDERFLTKKGLMQGDDEWESFGIAKSATWPRIKACTKGVDYKGNPLTKYYQTNNVCYAKKKREVKHVPFIVDEDSEIKAKEDLVVLLRNNEGKQIATKSSLVNNPPYIIDDSKKAAVLFDVEYEDEFIEQLSVSRDVEIVYISTPLKKRFAQINSRIKQECPHYYIEKPEEIPMADGFRTNAVFFKLGFLDKDYIALGRQFKELLPVLWMKAGAIGQCPSLPINAALPDMMVLPENKMAILIDENAYSEFKEKLSRENDMQMVYLITDSNDGFAEMSLGLGNVETCQLYRDYLDNFRINTERR